MMGAIMSIGVATANSILMITFANEQLREGTTALDAAIAAGHTRLRPVVMTALAMIIGMVPMALGLGEGGEQNAPLGRAVIGGLLTRDRRDPFLRPRRFQRDSPQSAAARRWPTIQILSAHQLNPSPNLRKLNTKHKETK